MKSFKRFYEANYFRAMNFTRQYILSREDTEDIVQSVFLTLYERWGHMEDVSNPVAYLFTSLKNESLKHISQESLLRQAQKDINERELFDLKLSYSALSQLDTSNIDDNEIYRRIYESIDKLPEKCRRIFVMSKMEGKKQKEIADILGISRNTVEAQMGIAYHKLRKELKDLFPMLLVLLNPIIQ